MTATLINEKIKTLDGLIVSKDPDLKLNPFLMAGVGGVGVSPPGGGGVIEAKRVFTINGTIEDPLSAKTD